MSTDSKHFKYLACKPGSNYKHLFIKDRWISARTLYGRHVNEEMPMTVEEIATDYNLPVEAVAEAITYCESAPPELFEDYAREQARIEAAGRKLRNEPTDPAKP